LIVAILSHSLRPGQDKKVLCAGVGKAGRRAVLSATMGACGTQRTYRDVCLLVRFWSEADMPAGKDASRLPTYRLLRTRAIA